MGSGAVGLLRWLAQLAPGVLSHMALELQRRYNKHQYADEKREALDAYTKHVAATMLRRSGPELMLSTGWARVPEPDTSCERDSNSLSTTAALKAR